MIGGDFGGTGSARALGMDAQKLLELMARPGWAGLENLAEQMEEARSPAEFSEADARNDAYLECFSSPAGQTVLLDLMENVLLMPSAGLTPGRRVEEHAAMAIAGDAQKMLVWGFLTRMRQALERRNLAHNPTGDHP